MAEYFGDVMNPDVQAMLLTKKEVIGKKEIQKASEILSKYKSGKQNLERRIVEDELWWEGRHWEAVRRVGNQEPISPEPTSAWLFNSLLNKHADAMDNYPEPIVLPREMSDKDSAKVLQSVLPVIMEQNEFESTYSENWWEKLKHGTAAYGVFWNQDKENGMGDIDITTIDLLKLFWEPGVTDIQESRNIFIVELVDTDLLDEQYPDKKGKLNGNAVDVKQYLLNDQVDNTNKSVVVDWYYKVKAPNGKTVVHYVKFVNDQLLYASENEPMYAQRGYYDHGMYPIVLDTLYPEKGSPVGFGYVTICKDPQIYIDKLDGNILETSMMGTKKRYMVSSSTNINEDEFADWTRPIVHVEGEIDDARIKEINVSPLSGHYINVLQMKIDEMKETASNRDISSGGAGQGITAAAAIAALQEAGNKTSRDMISSSYRAHVVIVKLCIELIRQFYDEKRAFRIVAPNEVDGYGFVDLDNSALKDQPVGVDSQGNPLFRKPVFDLKLKAQKKNPFSRMEMNETAKELYGAGFFNVQRAQEAMIALDMMEFEGIEEVKEKVMQGQTMFNMLQQAMQENMMMKAMLGIQVGPNGPAQPEPLNMQMGGKPTGDPRMTAYGNRLAKRSTPNIEALSNDAMPK